MYSDKVPEWQQELDGVLKWSEDGRWVCLSKGDQDESIHLDDTSTCSWTKLVNLSRLQEITSPWLVPFFIHWSQGKYWIALRILEEERGLEEEGELEEKGEVEEEGELKEEGNWQRKGNKTQVIP